MRAPGKAQARQQALGLPRVHAQYPEQADGLEVVQVIVRGHQFGIRQDVIEGDDGVRCQVDEGVKGKELFAIRGDLPVVGVRQRRFAQLLIGVRADAVEDDAAITGCRGTQYQRRDLGVERCAQCGQGAVPGRLFYRAMVDRSHQAVVTLVYPGNCHLCAASLLLDGGQVPGDLRQDFGPANAPALQVVDADFA